MNEKAAIAESEIELLMEALIATDNAIERLIETFERILGRIPIECLE